MNPSNADECINLDSSYNLNALTNREFSFEKIQEISGWLLDRTNIRPKIGIVCGSGLGGIGDLIKNSQVFPYQSIPRFPQSTVVGHNGNLIFGVLNDQPVVCMQGRFHTYEGYSNALCTMPIKVFKLLGVEIVILTCAAGGINRSFKAGDIMVIKDHIAPPLWTLQNPLVGHNDERFGPRFPAVTKIYSKSLRDRLKKIGNNFGIDLKEGVYSYLGGPCYDTVSEARALLILGTDAVGMSTSHEALMANYCGMNVLAVALITNLVVMEHDRQETANHEEVIDTANKCSTILEQLISEFVKLALD